MNLTDELKNEFVRRVFDESYPRVIKCLDLLNEKEIWIKPNKNTNSVGNLVLHLIGNAHQWIVSGLGKKPDIRIRQQEFIPNQKFTGKGLKQKLSLLKTQIIPIVENLNKGNLKKTYNIQVFKEKGSQVIIHVIEHFSYHTGQIALLTKLIADKDLNFYTETLD